MELRNDGGSGGGISELEVGITPITGGATTRILYDNAGVLGEYTISGSGTVVAMAAGATLTTATVNSVTLTAAGSATTFLNGAGAYTTPSGASITAPGSDTQVIFNDGGVFGADADLTWNKTTNVFTNAGSEIVPLISGSTAANGDITINGTTSATKTTSYVNLQATGGFVGIGLTAPAFTLDVIGTATSGVAIAGQIIGGTSSSAGGLKFGAYDGTFGGIWSAAVTPSITNYALVANSTITELNATTSLYMGVGGNANLQISSTGNVTIPLGGNLTVGAANGATGGYIFPTILLKPGFILDSSGTDYGFIQNDGASLWSLSNGTVPTTLGTPKLSWGKSVPVTITANASELSSVKALVANNSTSTGNIFEAQDNGTGVFFIGDAGLFRFLVSAGVGGDAIVIIETTAGGQYAAVNRYKNNDRSYLTGLAGDVDSWVVVDETANLRRLSLTTTGNLYLGNSMGVASPTSQSIIGEPGLGTDKTGGSVTIAGGPGTGAGIAGDHVVQTAKVLTTGTTLQTLGDRARILAKYTTLTESSATAFCSVTVATETTAGGSILYTVEANDGTDFQSLTGEVKFDIVNKGGTSTIVIADVQNGTGACSTGTLTGTITAVDAGSGVIQFKMNAVSSLTQTVLRINAQVRKNFGVGAIAAI